MHTIKENTLNATTASIEQHDFWSVMDAYAPDTLPIATKAITLATGETRDRVNAFLASRHGGRFARNVLRHAGLGHDLEQAVDEATHHWMDRTIGYRLGSHHGFHPGVSYLAALVADPGIETDD